MVKIDSILNECIEGIRAGETIEQCLARYPEQASELEALLQTVVSLQRVSSLQPSPEFRARARAQVLMAARGLPAQKQHAHGWFSWHKTWVPVAASAFTIMVMGSGTIVAASDALPGEPLYGVKRTVERVQVTVNPSDVGKAKLLAGFADRRVKELHDMVYAGHGDDIDAVSASAVNDLDRIKHVFTKAGDTRTAGVQAGQEAVVDKNAEGPAAAEVSPTVAVMAQPASPPEASSSEFAARVEREPEEDEIDVRDARNPAELRKALRQSGERQKEYLEDLLEGATEKDKAAITRAIEKISRAYEEASRDDDEDDDKNEKNDKNNRDGRDD